MWPVMTSAAVAPTRARWCPRPRWLHERGGKPPAKVKAEAEESEAEQSTSAPSRAFKRVGCDANTGCGWSWSARVPTCPPKKKQSARTQLRPVFGASYAQVGSKSARSAQLKAKDGQVWSQSALGPSRPVFFTPHPPLPYSSTSKSHRWPAQFASKLGAGGTRRRETRKMTEWAKESKNEGLNEEIKFMTITNERLEECICIKKTNDWFSHKNSEWDNE